MSLRMLSPTTTPFTTSGNISIVNSHYSQYGHSVLTPFSGDHQQYQHHTSSSNYGSGSGNRNRNKRGSSVVSNSSSVMPVVKRVNNNNGRDPSGSSNVVNYDEEKKRFNYKSLLIDNNVTKFLKKTLESDNFSIFSLRPNSLTICSLPSEVLKLILIYSDDYKTLINCVYVNKFFNKTSKSILYANPKLTSTYRVAQLVTSLKENPLNSLLIKTLDLSKLSTGLIVNEKYFENNQDEFGDLNSIHSNNNIDELYLDYALANWRDWKFKGDPLYGSSLLNSFNLSKNKSIVSIGSLSTVTTVNKLNFLQKIIDNELKLRLMKLKRKFIKNKKDKKKKNTITDTNASNNNNNVDIDLPKSISQRNQPFSKPHPYTNKFLLKYSSSKDIPIGYLIYFFENCLNLIDINLSSISVSEDWEIKYNDKFKQHIHFSSLIEELDPLTRSPSSSFLKPRFSSDSITELKKITNIPHELVKLQDFEILKSLSKLTKLEKINLSSITWLNFKNLQKFNNTLSSIHITEIDLTNSGMIRNLNWAKSFPYEEFHDYFSNETEPKEEEPEDPHRALTRRIGMNY